MKRLLLTALLVCTLPSCAKREAEGIDSLMKEDVYGGAIPVETLTLVPRTFEDRFEAAGVIEAEEEVTVSAEIAHAISKIHYEMGDKVHRGALLVTLDDSEVRARIRKIEALLARTHTQLTWALKDLDRQERLFATEVAAERAFDEAKRMVDTSRDEVAAAEADLEIAQVELSRCQIKSPISGTISQRYVASGEYVREGTELYDIVATDRVKFVFSLAERDITAVSRDQILPVRIDAHDEEAFSGPIRAISPAGSKQTRTFRVEIEILNDNEARLLPGMSGRTDVVRRKFADVFLLPEEAILRDEEGSYVYLAADTEAKRAVVTILSQVGDKAVVASSLGGSLDCIILGQSAVEQGSTIRVRRRHQDIPEARFD